VKAQTLYAYASRGLLRRVGSGKRRLYLLEDLERLRLRQRARAGHGPVAAAALSFGEPVLDTRISTIDERGPLYRGRPAVELALSGVSFEAVAELLWSGQLPDALPHWRGLSASQRLGAERSSLEGLLGALPALLEHASQRHSRAPDAELALGRQLLRSLAELLVSPTARSPERSIAQLLAQRSSLRASSAASNAVELALVLLADHELNASSFAARIAASTDASLPACLMAALATLSGPRHGGACDRVEALLDEASVLSRPAQVIERRSRRGEPIVGFGHLLYPRGDPRGGALLARAIELGRASAQAKRRVAVPLALARAMSRQGLPPTVDFGLVALTRALDMPSGSGALLFALGRSAGWIAHVLEQRESTAVLRPRARYLDG
jgi:citrate synthase